MSSRQALRATSLFFLVITLNAISATAHTTTLNLTDDDTDDYDITARVMRISSLSGEVSLRRSGHDSWELAKLNLPLVEGDTLTTGREARLEIQIDARNFVRLAPDSTLHIVTLRDEGLALSLTEGTASVRLARFDSDQGYFEIDAPKTTVAAEKRGLYRLDATPTGGVRITVRDGGRARIYSQTSGFTLRDKRMAELVEHGSEEGDWDLASAPSFDQWDRWIDERERFLASRLRTEGRERYYDREVWGAEELDAYGDWTYLSAYGWVWRPHHTVINHYQDWAPYRYGHWSWCPPYGWVWVGDEPWGWAPYHYGRWVYHDNNWCWAPRGYGYSYRRAWWRPALVAFIYLPTSYGEHVAWYPLGHGHRDPQSRYWQRHHERLTALQRHEVANLQRINPAHLRAVSTLPAREFGIATHRARPATTELARRAVAGEPVRGRLPITPPNMRRTGQGPNLETNAAARTRTSVARPASVEPTRRLPSRPTGAATRTPGISLDPELRRTRVFNNREPRIISPERVNSGSREDLRDTGAVARPADEQPADDGSNVERNNSSTVARPVRPARPARRDADVTPAEIPHRPEPRERRSDERPGVRDHDRGDREPEGRRARPARPVEDRPARTEEPRRSQPEYRREAPAARPRSEEPPSARPERSAPREERPPQPREERPPAPPPPPREERPAPPPRQDPPPQPRERPDRPSGPRTMRPPKDD